MAPSLPLFSSLLALRCTPLSISCIFSLFPSFPLIIDGDQLLSVFFFFLGQNRERRAGYLPPFFHAGSTKLGPPPPRFFFFPPFSGVTRDPSFRGSLQLAGPFPFFFFSFVEDLPLLSPLAPWLHGVLVPPRFFFFFSFPPWAMHCRLKVRSLFFRLKT